MTSVAPPLSIDAPTPSQRGHQVGQAGNLSSLSSARQAQRLDTRGLAVWYDRGTHPASNPLLWGAILPESQGLRQISQCHPSNYLSLSPTDFNGATATDHADPK